MTYGDLEGAQYSSGSEVNGRWGSIECTLPLQNHFWEPVVQHQDLHSSTELASCPKLHSSHAGTDVSIDVDDSLVWSGHLRVDSHRQTEANGLQTTMR